MFEQVPGKLVRPAYTGGQKDGEQWHMYQCPVSAIPDKVFDLLDLWWRCRLMGLPPKAGAFEDQDAMVQFAFPIFEGHMRGVERQAGGDGALRAATMAVGAMMKLFVGSR